MSRLSPFFLIGLALVAWELAARSGLWSPLLFPSLASIAHELGLLLSRADRLMEAWYSLYRALVALRDRLVYWEKLETYYV